MSSAARHRCRKQRATLSRTICRMTLVPYRCNSSRIAVVGPPFARLPLYAGHAPSVGQNYAGILPVAGRYMVPPARDIYQVADQGRRFDPAFYPSRPYVTRAAAHPLPAPMAPSPGYPAVAGAHVLSRSATRGGRVPPLPPPPLQVADLQLGSRRLYQIRMSPSAR